MNSIFNKFIVMCVALLFVLTIFVPVVVDINTSTTETETIEHEIGYNAMTPYTKTIMAELGSVEPLYTCVRGDYDTFNHTFTPNASGDYIEVPMRGAAGGDWGYTIGFNQHYYFSNTTTEFTYDGASSVMTQDWVVRIDTDSNNNNLGNLQVVNAGTGDHKMYVPYSITYTSLDAITYADNTLNTATVSSTVGTMSGTTFTADPTGDYISIPLLVLNNAQNTYKVLSGATYYAPDTNGDLAAFTAPTTTGVNATVTITFTQDTSITDATVYNMTVASTDVGLPNIVIPKEITVTVSVPVSNIDKVFACGNQTFYITTTGELYATGSNTSGELGTGNRTDVNTWTKVAENVVSVTGNHSAIGSSYYISTTGELYATGENGGGQLGTGDTNDLNTWTKVADGVVKVKGYYGGSGFCGAFYLGTDHKLYATGKSAYGFTGNGSNSSRTLTSWTEIATGVSDFDFMYMNDRGTAMYISTTGELYATGNNSYGQMGKGDTADVNTWTKVADNVTKIYFKGYDNNTYGSFYISTAGDLYATGKANNYTFGNNLSTNLTSWTQTASGVADVFIGQQYTLYLGTDHKLYATGSNSGTAPWGTGLSAAAYTWTETASGVSAAFTDGVFSYFSAYIGQNGKLYLTGNNSSIGLSYADSWVETASGVSDFINGKTTNNGSYAFYTTPNNGLAYIGDNLLGTLGTGDNNNVSSWTNLSTSSQTTIYTNTTESISVTDYRGYFSDNTLTPDVNGEYMLIQPQNLGNTYYIADGSTFYGPATGNFYWGMTVDNHSMLDSAITLTFTAMNPPSGNKIYSLTGTTTDVGLLGIVIPYSAVYYDNVTHNDGYNDVNVSEEVVFTPDENGTYIRVPGAVLADSNTYYADGSFYGPIGGHLVPVDDFTAGAVENMTLTVTDNAGLLTITGSGSGYIVVPVAYTGGTNPVDSTSTTFTPIRGNMAGDLFTPDADGAYMKVFEENIAHSDYQIGDGKVYYATIGGTTTSYTAPQKPSEGITMSLTATQGDEHVYDIDCTPTSDSDTLVIPYEVSWTETVTHVVEAIPLAGLAIVAAIIMCIMIGVSAVVKGGKL